MPERMNFFRPTKPRKREGRPNFWRRGYGKGWEATRLAVLIRDKWQCQMCGRVCGGKWEAHVDHVLRKAWGGGEEMESLQTLCQSCHSRKTHREQQPSI